MIKNMSDERFSFLFLKTMDELQEIIDDGGAAEDLREDAQVMYDARIRTGLTQGTVRKAAVHVDPEHITDEELKEDHS